MSEKGPGAVRQRRSRTEVDQLVAEYEASGMRRQEFCAKHGLSLATLARYRKRRQQRTAERPSGSRLLRVELSSAKVDTDKVGGSELVVMLASGRRIEVRRDFDAATLRELVQALEQS